MNSLSRRILLPRVTSFTFCTRKSSTPLYNCNNEINNRGSLSSARHFRTQIISQVSAAQHANHEEGFLRRIFQKYNLFNISRVQLKQSGYLLYESVADQINYAEFFTEFKMTDSFFSWFLITELHVWMLMVRTMAEQEDGKIVRNSMIEAMWGDTTTRAKVLWHENPGGVRRQVQELSEQFNSAIIGYDEGVNGDDKILAGAIWRRFYQLERNDPEDIEKLLIYVRKQINHLDKLPRENLLSKPDIKWLSLKNL